MKFVMLTDTKTSDLRVVLHQVWATLYVEYVVKNPLSPVEHPGGIGVNNEMFELGLDRFVVCISMSWSRSSHANRRIDTSIQSACLRTNVMKHQHCETLRVFEHYHNYELKILCHPPSQELASKHYQGRLDSL
jgi:hypothetical protein